MAKQKGKFAPGKYGHDLRWHVKGVRGEEEPFLEVTMRLTEEHVKKILRPQIEKFLRELDKQAARQKAKAGK